mgnify:FL=1
MHSPFKTVLMSAYAVVCVVLISKRKLFVPTYYELFGDAIDPVVIGVAVFILTGGLIFLGELSSVPHNNAVIRRKLQKIGLKNRIGQVPILRRYHENKDFKIYDFYTLGIPLETWEEYKDDLEAALDIAVISIEYKRGHSIVEIRFVYATAGVPDFVEWKKTYLSGEEFFINLGNCATGALNIDLLKYPHILIGGATGSGKTVLLKNVLHQMIDKGAEVYIADFKGGIDYSKPLWHRDVVFIDQKEKVVVCLDEIVEEMDRRKQLFLDLKASDIKKYNMHANINLPHIIFACDELAELLDTTGLSKEEKAVVQEIDSRLSTLARLGRAFGIHLVLATQRPDANIIRGQIKNNMNIRVCGKADQVLSQIILDNTSASTEIRGYQRGRFIMDDGTVFQGYWDEEV